MRKNAIFKLVLLLPLAISPVAYGQVDVNEIIQRSVQANEADWKVQPEYNYCNEVRESGHTKMFDVLMIEGTPYHRLVAVDGKMPSPQQTAEQEKKLKQAIASRHNETPQQRANRIAEWQRSQERNHLMIEQLTKAFNFKLEATRELDGHHVYELTATPRPGYQPPNKETKALTGMEGKLWIDQKSSQWVRVQAEVVRPVSIEGFLARVERGTRFQLNQAPIEPDVWFPTYFSMKSRAKIFFLIPHNDEEEDRYFDYRKASTNDPLAVHCPAVAPKGEESATPTEKTSQ